MLAVALVCFAAGAWCGFCSGVVLVLRCCQHVANENEQLRRQLVGPRAVHVVKWNRTPTFSEN